MHCLAPKCLFCDDSICSMLSTNTREGVKRCDILLSLLHDVVDADVLKANPNLKAVSSMNITQDRIDLATATSLGIPITNIPAIVTDATADIGFGLLLAITDEVTLADIAADHLAHPLDDEWHRSRTPDWSKVITPFLSCANWGAQGIHLRGNIEGFVRAAIGARPHGGTS